MKGPGKEGANPHKVTLEKKRFEFLENPTNQNSGKNCIQFFWLIILCVYSLQEMNFNVNFLFKACKLITKVIKI